MAGALRCRVLRGEGAQRSVLDRVTGDTAGGLAVEAVYLRRREQVSAIGRIGDPVDIGNAGGYVRRLEFACLRIPVEGHDAVGLIGADEYTLTFGLCKRPRCNACDGKGCGSPEKSEEHTSELQSPVHLVCRL